MGVATEARRALEALPPGVRETVETFGAFLPRPFLYGRTFRATRASLARSEREPSPIDHALDGAIVTPRELWDAQAAARLDAVARRLLRPAEAR